MVSLSTFFITIIAVVIVTAVATVFVYRNNMRKIGGIADKVDKIHDVVKDE